MVEKSLKFNFYFHFSKIRNVAEKEETNFIKTGAGTSSQKKATTAKKRKRSWKLAGQR